VKFNGYQYENMIIDLNINRSKKILLGSFFAAFATLFIVILIFLNDFYLGIIGGTMLGIAIYSGVKKYICENTKKAGLSKYVKSFDQKVFKTKIVEVLTNFEDKVSTVEYEYKDFVLVKIDRKNYYLYVSANSAIVIRKDTLADIETFENILKNHNLI
jgi:hypothetical protein